MTQDQYPDGISAMDAISTLSVTPVSFRASRIIGWQTSSTEFTNSVLEYFKEILCSKYLVRRLTVI